MWNLSVHLSCFTYTLGQFDLAINLKRIPQILAMDDYIYIKNAYLVNFLLSGKLCWYDGEWDGGRGPGPAQGEGRQRQGHPQEGEEVVKSVCCQYGIWSDSIPLFEKALNNKTKIPLKSNFVSNLYDWN